MTLALVPDVADIPTDDLVQRMAQRTVRERNLRAAFAAVIEYDDWQPALEMLAAEMEDTADEAGRWNPELWRMRQRGLIELSADRDLRGE